MKRHVRFVSLFVKYKRQTPIILTNTMDGLGKPRSFTVSHWYMMYIMTAFIVAAQRMVWKN